MPELLSHLQGCLVCTTATVCPCLSASLIPLTKRCGCNTKTFTFTFCLLDPVLQAHCFIPGLRKSESFYRNNLASILSAHNLNVHPIYHSALRKGLRDLASHTSEGLLTECHGVKRITMSQYPSLEYCCQFGINSRVKTNSKQQDARCHTILQHEYQSTYYLQGGVAAVWRRAK